MLQFGPIAPCPVASMSICMTELYHRKDAAERKGTAVAVEGTGPNNYTVLPMEPDSYLKFDLWVFFAELMNSL